MLKYGLHTLSISDTEREVKNASLHGSKIIRLPNNISDKASFVDGLKGSAPLDPPVTTPNWDALEDSLWEGLHSVTEESVVIVWPNADLMKATSPADFAIAIEIFESLTRTLNSDAITLNAPKRLCVFLTSR